MLFHLQQIPGTFLRTLRRLCVIAIPFLSVFNVFSQPTSTRVSFTLSRDSIVSGNGEMAEFTVQLNNSTANIFSGSLAISPGNGIELVSKSKTPLQLQPGEKYFVAVKFIMPKRMVVGQLGRIGVTLLNSDDKPEQENFVSLAVTASRSVNLNVGATEMLLKKTNDSLHIPVRLINTGNTAQKILVVASFPVILKKSSNLQRLFVLPAFADTVIYFHKRITSEMFKTDGFYITVTGLYFNGDAFGSQTVNAQPARSARVFSERNGSFGQSDNTLTLSAQNLGTNNEWYQVLSNGSLQIRQQKVDYNLDASFYTQAFGGQPLQLRNTFLTYRKDDWGVTAGNIGRNYDLNLSGRGVVAFMDDSAHTHYAEAGYIDKSQNLLGQSGKFLRKPGNSAWASYIYSSNIIRLRSAAVYDINTSLQTKTVLLTNELIWTTKKRYMIKAILNGGKDNSLLVKDSSRTGFGAGLGFEGRLGNFYISSTNYLSSAYYPGMTKGVLNLNQRVNWARPRFNLWTAVNYFRIAPAPIPGFNFNINSTRLRVENGISFSVQKINLSLSPSFSLDKGNDYSIGQSSLQAMHMSVSVNYLNPVLNQFFFLNSEGGMYKSSVLPGNHFHQKTMLNIRHRFLSLNAIYQSGNFYLSEIIYSSGKPNRMLMISPQLQKEIFSHRARIQCGVSFTNSTLGGVSLQQTGMVEYDYSLKTKLFAGADYTYYKSSQYQYANIRAGVTLRLPEAKIGSKTGSTLDVFLFKDMNENGIFDKGDSVVVDAYVTINNMIFITGPDGMARYKNVPAGYYRINVTPLKGWFGQEKLIPSLTKNMRVEIPMQKTGVVKGNISYIFNQYSYETTKSKDGVFISAVNKAGARFTAMTNGDGQFLFYLPAGEYDINLKKENIPDEIECLNTYEKVVISPQEVFLANFVLKVKERKVETKKFTSPSLASAKP